MNIYGYFDQPNQEEPAFDPGLDVACPFCQSRLLQPVVTISLMVPGDSRSYFYRADRACYYNAADEIVTEVESVLVDAIYSAKASN